MACRPEQVRHNAADISVNSQTFRRGRHKFHNADSAAAFHKSDQSKTSERLKAGFPGNLRVLSEQVIYLPRLNECDIETEGTRDVTLTLRSGLMPF